MSRARPEAAPIAPHPPHAPDPLPAGWDHAGHLRALWEALRQNAFAEAMRHVGGRRAARGHATLALAWARLVEAALAPAGSDEDFDAFLARNPALRDANHIYVHYSPERIGSERARDEFVLPDRSPLPRAPRVRRGRESVSSS